MNVNNMSLMFDGFFSLKSLPDILIWNTSKVRYINNMFNFCSSLSTLSDISKWYTKNINHMSFIFRE